MLLKVIPTKSFQCSAFAPDAFLQQRIKYSRGQEITEIIIVEQDCIIQFALAGFIAIQILFSNSKVGVLFKETLCLEKQYGRAIFSQPNIKARTQSCLSSISKFSDLHLQSFKKTTPSSKVTNFIKGALVLVHNTRKVFFFSFVDLIVGICQFKDILKTLCADVCGICSFFSLSL